MSILINLIGVLAFVANALFALNAWFGVSQPTQQPVRGRTAGI